MKKLLVIAVAAGLIAPAAAMADTTLYGKLHASVGSVKTTTAGVSNTETAVESHASRFGVKGSTALDNGMSAVYGVEFGLSLDGDGNAANGAGDVATGAVDANSRLNSRNTFVGLKGGFGEVRVGRHDTPAKLATAGQDIFADTYADLSNIITTDGDRVHNAVAYINKFGPVGVAAAHSTAIGSSENAAAHSADANTMMVNYSTGPWYAGLGHTAIQNTAKKTNLGLGWKAEAGHAANLIYEKVDNANTPNDGTNVLLNGAYKMGNVTLKGQVGEAKVKNAGKEKLSTLGVDYSLGKKTSVYLLHSIDKNDAKVLNGNDKVTATAVGLVTEF